MTGDDPTTSLSSDLEKLDVGTTKDDGSGTQADDNKTTDDPKDESQAEDNNDKKETDSVEPVTTNDGGNTS